MLLITVHPIKKIRPMSDKTNINEDHNAHHVYIDFYTIIEGLLAVSHSIFSQWYLNLNFKKI